MPSVTSLRPLAPQNSLPPSLNLKYPSDAFYSITFHFLPGLLVDKPYLTPVCLITVVIPSCVTKISNLCSSTWVQTNSGESSTSPSPCLQKHSPDFRDCIFRGIEPAETVQLLVCPQPRQLPTEERTRGKQLIATICLQLDTHSDQMRQAGNSCRCQASPKC